MKIVGMYDTWFVEQFRNGIISIGEDFRIYRVSDRVNIDRLADDNYYQIFLWDSWEQKIKTMYSHRLVWMIFNGQYIPENLIINHADGIKTNNHPFNLELSNHSWNNSHAHLLQLNSSRGELNSRALFSNQDVYNLRKLFATTDLGSANIAKENNVTRQQMWQLLKCKTYQFVITPYDDVCKRK